MVLQIIMLNVRFSDRSSPLFHNVTINSLCRSALLTIFIPTRKKSTKKDDCCNLFYELKSWCSIFPYSVFCTVLKRSINKVPP